MMSIELTIILILLIAVLVLLASEKISYFGVSVLVLTTLTVSGILEPKETLANIADPTIMLYVGSFIISAAFGKVRLAQMIGKRGETLLVKISHNEELVLFCISIAIAILTIFLQAMAIQVAMMTIILSLADQLGISKKKALLALGFSATIGSTFTLLGNNVNLLAKAAYEETVAGGTWAFMELSLLTVPMGLVMMALFCFGTSKLIRDDPKADPVWDQRVQDGSATKTEDETTAPGAHKLIVLAVTAFFIFSLVLDGKFFIPANVAVLLCATVLVMTNVMTTEEIMQSISWPIILFTVSVLALSSAFSKVGAGDYLAELVVRLLGDTISLRTMVVTIFIVATLATQVLSNSGTFAVILPIVVPLAVRLGIPVKPVIVTLCLASSCAYLTPLSAPTFPILAAAGKISFKEFFIQGLPLTVISIILSAVFIPILWG